MNSEEHEYQMPKAEQLPGDVIQQIPSIELDTRFITVIENMESTIELFLPDENDDEYIDEMKALAIEADEFLKGLQETSNQDLVYLSIPDDNNPSLANLLTKIVYDGFDLVDKSTISVKIYLDYLISDAAISYLLTPFDAILQKALDEKRESRALNIYAHFNRDAFSLLTNIQQDFIAVVTEEAREELGAIGARAYFNQLSSNRQQELVALSPKEVVYDQLLAID